MSLNKDKLRANFEGIKIAEKYANPPFRFGTLYPTGELTICTPVNKKPPPLNESWSPNTPNSSNFFTFEEDVSTKMYWSPGQGLTLCAHSKNPKFATWVYELKSSSSPSGDSPGSTKYSGDWVLLDETNGESDEELLQVKESSSSSTSSSSSYDATHEEKKDTEEDSSLIRIPPERPLKTINLCKEYIVAESAKRCVDIKVIQTKRGLKLK